MSKPTPRTRTDWQTGALAFFKAHGADVAEELGEPSLGFHIGQDDGQRRGYIKNPCPTCIGGRLFPEWDRFTHKWYMKCICCGRLALKEDKTAYTVQDWDKRLTNKRNGAKGGRNGKRN